MVYYEHANGTLEVVPHKDKDTKFKLQKYYKYYKNSRWQIWVKI